MQVEIHSNHKLLNLKNVTNGSPRDYAGPIEHDKKLKMET